jgi:phosphonatase-like hydrolase
MITRQAGRTVDLAVLDLVGTTIHDHSAVYSGLLDAVEAAGGRADRLALHRWLGLDRHGALAAMLPPEGDRPDPDRVDTVHRDFLARLDAACAEHPPTPVEGALQVFRDLRAGGVQVALSSTFPRDVTAVLLRAAGWDVGGPRATVDALVAADDVPAGRPAPYQVFRAMELTGTQDVARVLVCGDAVLDLRAGTNAGARYVVGVLTGHRDADTLRSVRHTHVVPSVRDLPRIALPAAHPALPATAEARPVTSLPR